MVSLVLLRHFPTGWNREGRIQGRHDEPLLPESAAIPAGRRVDPELAGRMWYASPLRRARDTAALLGAEPATDERLAEMDWGDWEGCSLEELRTRLGEEMRRNEERGLDFRPAGGESPREVRERVRAFAAAVARRGRPAVAVTHKGVIRAALSLALDWDMTGRAPTKLDWSRAHEFDAGPDGLRLVAANRALYGAGGPSPDPDPTS